MDQETLRIIVTGAIALVAGLGGASLTAVFNRRNTKDTLAAARQAAEDQWVRSQEREHAVWLRDQKQEVYAEFLACANAVVQQLVAPGPKDEKQRTITEMGVWLGRVTLVGSDAIVTLSNSISVRAAKAVALHEGLLDAESGFLGASPEEARKLRGEFNVLTLEFMNITDVYTSVVREELGTRHAEAIEGKPVAED